MNNMIFKILSSILLIVVFLFPSDASAQNENIRAIIESDTEVAIASPVVFDAKKSEFPDTADISFTWTFGDGNTGSGKQITHTFSRPGLYAVVLTLSVDDKEYTDTAYIRVFSTEILLLVDDTVPEAPLVTAKESAAEKDILLRLLYPDPTETRSTEGLIKTLLARRDSLLRSPLLIIWTSSTTSTDTIAQIGQRIDDFLISSERPRNINHLGIVIITEQSFGPLNRPAQTAFNILKPRYVLLTRPESLSLITESSDPDKVIENIRVENIQFQLLGEHSARTVDRLTPWNAVSYIVNGLVHVGVPLSSVVLVLMLPVIATLIAFSRQIIGVKAFGIFTPTVVTLSFIALGLRSGMVVFIGILVAAMFSRMLIRRFHLQYLPRMALVLTIVACSILLLFWIGGIVGEVHIVGGAVFPILILASLAEQFVDTQTRLGSKTAARLVAETLALAVVSTLVVQWDVLRSFIVGYPEAVLITIPINIALGRWSGLRLTEYFRFRELIFLKNK